MSSFKWPVRIYYEDTDSGGVVYYANYLKYMERARTEWLRSFGIEQPQLQEKHGVVFVVRSVALEYLRPARFNDFLQVTVVLKKCGKASMVMEQTVYRVTCSTNTKLELNDNGELLCQGRIKIACVDAITFKARSIPQSVLGEITDEC
ncbi:MAG: tol-pal system-associated acyl-CoA thioesterase [Gammaproteobacteria bacterium]|nr:tol-pal system-associated acyl-CoA thioesterase [Gammaproteobacteria bacterium]